jgi:hypothetical protein
MDYGFTTYSDNSCSQKKGPYINKYSFTLQAPVTTTEGLTAHPLESVRNQDQKTSKDLVVVQGDKLIWAVNLDGNNYPIEAPDWHDFL